MTVYYHKEPNLFQEEFLKNTTIQMNTQHPILIANQKIDWENLLEEVKNHIYKGKPTSRGRYLHLRAHCGIYLLQASMGWTDREAEDMLYHHGPTRVFCGLNETLGKGIDHTRIEKFRNQRLGLQGAELLNKYLLRSAKKHGFTNGKSLDVDTTVQEAGITYPTEMKLLKQFQKRVKRIAEQCGGLSSQVVRKITDLSNQGKKFFRHYSLFLREKSKTKLAKKKKQLTEKMRRLSSVMLKELNYISGIKDKLQIRPYVQKEIDRLTSLVPTLLEQIKYWLDTGKVAASKIISLHKLIPSVISKGKIGKTAEIGRKIIINQYTGGFLQVFIPKKSNPSDQKILKESIQGAMRTFKEKIESIGADRGFSSGENIKRCRRYHIKKIGIQPKGQGEWEVDREMARELYCRRAAIEPRIGIAGRLGLKHSRAKSDNGDAVFAHRSVTGFNLKKLIRCWSI